MGSASGLSVVFDTNVLVSALLFSEGRLVWLRDAWKSGGAVPVLDRPCLEELLRSLAYPKFDLSPEEIRALLEGLLPFAELIEATKGSTELLPVCRDPDDQKFLELAASSSVDVLVTGDKALLELSASSPVAIETPSQFRLRCQRKEG